MKQSAEYNSKVTKDEYIRALKSALKRHFGCPEDSTSSDDLALAVDIREKLNFIVDTNIPEAIIFFDNHHKPWRPKIVGPLSLHYAKIYHEHLFKYGALEEADSSKIKETLSLAKHIGLSITQYEEGPLAVVRELLAMLLQNCFELMIKLLSVIAKQKDQLALPAIEPKGIEEETTVQSSLRF